MKLLLKHCHLIIDEHKECLDGALLINEDYIEEVYPQTNKLNLLDIKELDLKGNIVMPDFFNGEKNRIIVDPLKNDDIKKETIVFIGNTKAYKDDIKDLQYDGIYDLYNNMTGFSHDKLGIVNEAFINLDKYVELDALRVNEDVLKFTLNNLRKDRVILINDLESSIKLLKKLNVNYTDILAYTSINAYKLYGSFNLNGSLVKGKHSRLIVLDENMNIIRRINKENFDA